MILARLSFLGQEIATQREAVSQHAIESGRIEAAFDVFRLLVGGDIEVAADPGVHVLKCCGQSLPVQEVSCRDFIPLASDLRPNNDQQLGFVIGQRREERRVVYRKDRRGSANAQRQGQQDGESHAGILAHHALAWAQIPNEISHGDRPEKWSRDGKARLRPSEELSEELSD